MRWEALFADMEARLDAVSAADLAVEVAERTRAERATIELADRLRAGAGRRLALTLVDGTTVEGLVLDVGPSWLLLDAGAREHLVPLRAVDVVDGLGELAAPRQGDALRRLGLGHALRALARDRQVVRLESRAGATVGRVDAVGADHVDVGLADPATLRPTGRRRSVPFASLVLVTHV